MHFLHACQTHKKHIKNSSKSSILLLGYNIVAQNSSFKKFTDKKDICNLGTEANANVQSKSVHRNEIKSRNQENIIQIINRQWSQFGCKNSREMKKKSRVKQKIKEFSFIKPSKKHYQHNMHKNKNLNRNYE